MPDAPEALGVRGGSLYLESLGAIGKAERLGNRELACLDAIDTEVVRLNDRYCALDGARTNPADEAACAFLARIECDVAAIHYCYVYESAERDRAHMAEEADRLWRVWTRFGAPRITSPDAWCAMPRLLVGAAYRYKLAERPEGLARACAALKDPRLTGKTPHDEVGVRRACPAD
jgi:hypothetical protein